ncbi:hypothetical protein T12_5259 [Trichinella patagoniensis]|uniref:Uncharacterized protein n=1 Tax=Trichinella patagoniensis TaxID=990121 RepID=A0A0V0ZAS4_9BILA|nr:hypothetical protein T12_5259 [Trichinella patagoniensis]
MISASLILRYSVVSRATVSRAQHGASLTPVRCRRNAQITIWPTRCGYSSRPTRDFWPRAPCQVTPTSRNRSEQNRTLKAAPIILPTWGSSCEQAGRCASATRSPAPSAFRLPAAWILAPHALCWDPNALLDHG